jgi:Fe-S cluster assembly protein SufD
VGREFIDRIRREALERFDALEMPTWRRSGFWTTSLKGLDLETLEPKHHEAASLDDLPQIVRDAVGDPSRLAGLVVQNGASTVISTLSPEAAEKGVIVCSLEDAIENHPELVEPYFMKRLSSDEGKFAAGSAAFWSGGVFVHVPDNVVLEAPIQTLYLIDEPGTAQYAHTLVVVGANSEAYVREACVAPGFEGTALHAGAFEMYCGAGSNARLAHYQDWGSGDVYDISIKRVEIGRDAICKWVPIHLGGKLTKQTLDIITAEQGSDMRHTGLYFVEGTEHLDLFTTDLKEKPNTNGDTVWKGALTGESRASYEGLIKIIPGATDSHTYLQTHSMLLSAKAKADSIPSLIVEVDNVSASHGGTVGEIDEELVFYMMTRGISRTEAVRILIEGYFEDVIQRLEDDQLEDLARGRIAQKIVAAEEAVADFVAHR